VGAGVGLFDGAEVGKRVGVENGQQRNLKKWPWQSASIPAPQYPVPTNPVGHVPKLPYP